MGRVPFIRVHAPTLFTTKSSSKFFRFDCKVPGTVCYFLVFFNRVCLEFCEILIQNHYPTF